MQWKVHLHFPTLLQVCKNTTKDGKDAKFWTSYPRWNHSSLSHQSGILAWSSYEFLLIHILYLNLSFSEHLLAKLHISFSVQSTWFQFSPAPLLLLQFLLPLIHSGKRTVLNLTTSRTDLPFWICRYSAGR